MGSVTYSHAPASGDFQGLFVHFMIIRRRARRRKHINQSRESQNAAVRKQLHWISTTADVGKIFLTPVVVLRSFQECFEILKRRLGCRCMNDYRAAVLEWPSASVLNVFRVVYHRARPWLS